jgi:hypothetical protein
MRAFLIMKLCKDCKHHYKNPGTTDRCYHSRYGIELVNGIPEWRACNHERWYGWLISRVESRCGKEGRYFEAKQ